MRIERFSQSDNPERFRGDFSMLAEQVRSDPYRIGMLAPAICERIISAPYPAPSEFWLLYGDDRPIGRVSANVSASRPEYGFFGLLEFDPGSNTAGKVLLDVATDWLAECRVRRILGPIAFNTWFPYRLRLDDGDERHFPWEPVNPPDHVQAVSDCGFEICQKYGSTAFSGLDEVLNKLEPAYRRSLANGFAFEAIAMDSIAERIPELHDITHEAFANNYLFEPLPLPLFEEAYLGIANYGHSNHSWFAHDSLGNAAGFLYAFIDNPRDGAHAETPLVLKSIAVMPEQRGHGLSNALVYLALRDGADHGADYAISATVHSGIQSESYARKGRCLWRHEYALWQKTL